MRALPRPFPGLFAASLVLACAAPPADDTSATQVDPGSTDAATTITSTDSTGPASTGTTTAATSSTTLEPTTASPTTDALTTGTTTDTTTGTTTGDATTGDATTGDPLDAVLTLQHAQIKGTHNSYHVEPLIPFDASHEYTHAPLDVQLESQGVRAFELDVHKGLGGDFEVYHIAVIDAVSTCATLPACLGTMRQWSLAHPDHLPIVVWIEIKDQTGGLPIEPADLDALDDAIRGVLPPEQLLTPDDLQGDHPSVRAALEADGWPALAATRGQFVVVLLNVEDEHAEAYTDGYTTLAGRAMFARATPPQFGAPWAAIAKLGLGGPAAIAQAHAARMLIATNTCSAGDSDAACTSELEATLASGIHMLKDDFPAPIDGKAYFLDFPDGNPARCNPVTAPPECTSAALEDL